jgi:O-antigen ligase
MVESMLARHPLPIVYAATAAASVAAGVVVARSQQGVSISLIALVALAGVAVLVNIPPRPMFLGWLFAAPFLESAADHTALGRGLTWALYLAPLLVMLGLTLIRRDPTAPIAAIDWLPAAYVVYSIGSIAVTTDLLHTDSTGTAKAVLLVVAAGPIIYYYLTFGPGRAVSPRPMLAVLLIGAGIQGVLAMIEARTGWNVWGFTGWQTAAGGARAVSTLTNPGILGAFLGVGIVTAITILVWDGPTRLRRLSWAVLVLATPGLALTLTRAPILATALVGLALPLIRRRTRLVGVVLVAATALSIAFVLPSIRSSELYETRIADRTNVTGREVLQKVSLDLAKRKPLFGYGYGSFNRVKNASGITVQGVPIAEILRVTSHDTYLTVLVELGAVGVLLFGIPFVVLVFRGTAQVWKGTSDDWIVVASISSLAVLFLTAVTLDFRYFSIAQMLPFLFLAILRQRTRPPLASRS